MAQVVGKILTLIVAQFYLSQINGANLVFHTDNSVKVLTDEINLLQLKKPYPATEIRKKVLATMNKLKQTSLLSNNLRQLQKYTAQIANHLPHTGDGLELEKLLEVHPELGQSEDSDEVVNVTNCLCAFYEESHQEDKCEILISKLKKHPRPNAAAQIYLLIRKNRLPEALLNYPQVVQDMKTARGIAEKFLPDKKPWITITLLSSALFSKNLKDAGEYAVQFRKEVAETSPSSLYRFYGGVLESAVLLSQGDYGKAREVTEKTRKEILENVDGPISPLAWIDLHRLILAAQSGDLKKSNEIIKDIDNETRLLPAEHYISLFSRSAISYLESGDLGPSWQSASEILGLHNPSLNRIKATITQAIRPRKQVSTRER